MPMMPAGSPLVTAASRVASVRPATWILSAAAVTAWLLARLAIGLPGWEAEEPPQQARIVALALLATGVCGAGARSLLVAVAPLVREVGAPWRRSAAWSVPTLAAGLGGLGVLAVPSLGLGLPGGAAAVGTVAGAAILSGGAVVFGDALLPRGPGGTALLGAALLGLLWALALPTSEGQGGSFAPAVAAAVGVGLLLLAPAGAPAREEEG